MGVSFRVLTPMLVAAAASNAVGAAGSAVVRGDVRGQDGLEVPAAVVSLVPQEDGAGRLTASSNRAGAFLFGSVRPGRYAVQAEADGGVLARVTGVARVPGSTGEAWRVEKTPGPEDPVVVAIGEGEDVQLSLRLERGLRLEGGTVTVGQALDASLAKIQRGDCGGAEKDLLALLAVENDVPKAHYLVGFCRGSRGDVDGALEALDRTLNLRPGYPGASLLTGQILLGAKRVPEAEAAFRAEIDAAGRDDLVRDAWWGLGLVLRDAERPGEALAAFEQAATLGGGKAEAWVEAAELKRARGDLPGAERALTRASEARAPVAQPLLNLGVSLFNERSFEDAIRVFRAASESDDATPTVAAMAYALLGKSLLAARLKTEATEALRRSLEIAPAGEFADEARKLLQEAER